MASAVDTATHKQRNIGPLNYWKHGGTPISFGNEQFRLTAVQGRNPPLPLTDLATAFDWTEDASHIVSGNLTIQRPQGQSPQFGVGMFVRCEATPWGQNQWREVWRMRAHVPQYTRSTDSWSFQLMDDLQWLQRSTDDFKYRRDRAHPHGWKGEAVIRDVCHIYGIQVGRLPKMKTRITNLVMMKTSPVAVIQQVLKQERLDAAHRYFIRWGGGRLNVVPYQRSQELLLLGGNLIDATVQQALPSNFGSVLDTTLTSTKGTARDAKGHLKRGKAQGHVLVKSKQAIARYGFIHQTATVKGDSIADARHWALREIVKRAQPTNTVEFTHPGITTVRRGSAIQINIPQVALKSIAYVTDVTHSVASGSYTMDVKLTFSDPFPKDKRPGRVAKGKAQAAARHGRKHPSGTPSTPAPRSRSGNYTQRRDA